MFIFKEDTIDFSVKQGDKLQSVKMIGKVYSNSTAEVHEEIYEDRRQEFLEK